MCPMLHYTSHTTNLSRPLWPVTPPVCRYNTSVPASQYYPHHLTIGGGLCFMLSCLEICFDMYPATSVRWADTKENGSGGLAATGEKVF